MQRNKLSMKKEKKNGIWKYNKNFNFLKTNFIINVIMILKWRKQMIIDNWRLLESIEQSISEYNNQFWREEDEDKKIDYSSIEYSEDGESANIPEEILSKLERLSISLISRDVGEKEIQDITKQLSQMLDVMKLKLFSFSMQARGPQYSHLDISFLEHLNDDIENISITGIDLSQEEPAKFERFKNQRRGK